jgi:adenosylhomocysteine nucleosidase
MRDIPIEMISGRRVLFVMAVEAEYGRALRKLFRPLLTGVGPVEAAIATSTTLARLNFMNLMPDIVVSLGSAGSKTFSQGEVYQAGEISYRDMDARPIGIPKGVTPFLGLPASISLSLYLPNVPVASLSSGANIVSGAAYNEIASDMVDMESYSVLRAAMMWDVEVIALRGISDGAEELTHLSGWTEYLHVVDENLAHSLGGLQVTLKNM